MQVLDEPTIRSLIDSREALEAVRGGFAALAEGRVQQPPIMDLMFPGAPGEAHVKAAHVAGAPFWTLKVGTGFYSNPERGLPSGSSMTLVLSAETGLPEVALLDGGFLTDLRTAAAGALAAELLAPREIDQALILGAGAQAAYQARALLDVRRPGRIAIWARRPDAADALAAQLEGMHACSVKDLETAVRESQLIITVTPSRDPLFPADWVSPGTHITAVGSDLPGKRELDPDLLRSADLVACDEPSACRSSGELQHLGDDLPVVALGELVLGRRAGRTAADQVTVCDLVGLGVQDAVVAAHVVRRSRNLSAR